MIFFVPLFFLLRCAQVVHRCRRLIEAGETRNDFLKPLPQLGHVLWRFVYPRQRRAAQLEDTNPDGEHEQAKHDGSGKHQRNVAAGQPADERFQRHCGNTSQEDRQDHWTRKIKKGNRPQHNQDDLHRRRFGRRCGDLSSGQRLTVDRTRAWHRYDHRVILGRDGLGYRGRVHIQCNCPLSS